MVSDVAKALLRLADYIRAMDEWDAAGQPDDPPKWCENYSFNPDASSFRTLDSLMFDDIRTVVRFHSANRQP